MLRRSIVSCRSVLAALVVTLLCSQAHAINVAGVLLVDLSADHASAGTATWTNTAAGGGAVGNFAGVGTQATGTLGGAGTNTVLFSGVDYYQSALDAPAGLVGLNPTRTIEVWAYNPSLPGEETLVSWGHRGGPNGSNMAFNFGNNPDFGAVGHWGGPDIGWGATAPPANQWQHLVYTYDGTTTRVYANGVLKNTEVLGAGVINTHAGTEILIGAQWDNTTTVTGGLRYSGGIAQVRVHDGVLSDAQIAGNFSEELGRFYSTTPAPIHRYSFDGNGGIGSQVTDSIGGAHGVLLGSDGSAHNGTGQLNLGGGGSATAGYVDLPNGIVSGLTNATLEAWVTWDNSSQNWSRIFDFGDNTQGEVNGPGGGFSGNGGGADGYFFVTPGSGTGGNLLGGVYEPGPGEVQAIAGFRLSGGIEHQIGMIFDDTNDLMSIFVDGQIVATTNIAGRSLSDILDINNWLGRSNFSGDENFDGLFNEFRIYGAALNADQILGNFFAGPNSLNLVPVPEPATGLLGLLAFAALGRRRRHAA